MINTDSASLFSSLFTSQNPLARTAPADAADPVGVAAPTTATTTPTDAQTSVPSTASTTEPVPPTLSLRMLQPKIRRPSSPTS